MGKSRNCPYFKNLAIALKLNNWRKIFNDSVEKATKVSKSISATPTTNIEDNRTENLPAAEQKPTRTKFSDVHTALH